MSARAHGDIECAEDREGGGDFDRGGGTEAGAEWHVAGDGEGEAVVDGDSVLAKRPEDAGGVVGPLFGAGGEQLVDGAVNALVEVDGVGEEAAVGARRDGDEGGEVDGGGHDEAAGVVGVLADEVDAAGCAVEGGGGGVGRGVEGGEFVRGLQSVVQVVYVFGVLVRISSNLGPWEWG